TRGSYPGSQPDRRPTTARVQIRCRAGTVAAGLLLSMILLTGASAAATALPAPMTLAGVGGVTPGMTPQQVQRTWGTDRRDRCRAVHDGANSPGLCEATPSSRGSARPASRATAGSGSDHHSQS